MDYVNIVMLSGVKFKLLIVYCIIVFIVFCFWEGNGIFCWIENYEEVWVLIL